MNPVPPVIGGAIQIYIDGMIPFLSNKLDLTVLSVQHKALPNYEIRDGVVYYRFPGKHYEAHVYDHLLSNFYDILHIFNRPRYVQNYHHASPHSKIILSLHNEMMAEHKISSFRGQRVINLCDAIVTVSKYIRNTLIQRFPKTEGKIFPIYSAVDTDRFKPYWIDHNVRNVRNRLRKEYDLDGYKIILFVGRLSKVKGVDLLIEAIKEVAGEYPKGILLIVGSKWFGTNDTNKYVDALYDAAKALPDHVKFANFIPPARMPDFYAIADLFVCASQWNEPLARVHYEAMASGLPIITTDRGGNAEVIKHGENGIVLSNSEYNQPEAFARAILRLLQNENEAKALALTGYYTAKNHFTFQRLSKEILEIYKKIMGKKADNISKIANKD